MLARTCLKKGEGTPLVFLHGFLGNSSDWEAVVEPLPYPCYGIDLPGHGASPFTPHFSSHFLEATSFLPRFHLIGYSMGGRLALQHAIAHPENIASLVLLSSHLGLKQKEERKQRLERDLDLAKKIVTLSIDEFLLRWYDQPLFHPLLSKLDIRAMRRHQNQRGLSKALSTFSLGVQPDCSLSLPQNTHLLAGELDEAYLRHYASLTHTVVPNSGHAIHLEEPYFVAQFLQEIFS